MDLESWRAVTKFAGEWPRMPVHIDGGGSVGLLGRAHAMARAMAHHAPHCIGRRIVRRTHRRRRRVLPHARAHNRAIARARARILSRVAWLEASGQHKPLTGHRVAGSQQRRAQISASHVTHSSDAGRSAGKVSGTSWPICMAARARTHAVASSGLLAAAAAAHRGYDLYIHR